ncbi:MAG: TIGR02452 family protein [Myxococcales bacterium]|nr:TIGR02452 family protein [Myxococcales bacterium]
MSLKGLAAETISIVDRGHYKAPSGRIVSIEPGVRAMLDGTFLYDPTALTELVAGLGPVADPHITQIQVTGETTGAALRRLVVDEGRGPVFALNFASAKNPGGGFVGGAKAQEEDLCRVSALYPSQLTKRAYYDENRSCGTMLYTDHAIYSPGVVFFRDERLELLEAPFEASILTMPAPNAGEHARHGRGGVRAVREALERRIAMVLAVARTRGYRSLVLGAWGCGVFRNDPAQVAALFDQALESAAFKGAFERVVFAVYDRKEGPNRRAFEERFTGR